jgi:8-oxo-dGTP pyrophosphatase MutT (NUDIX family)
MQTTIIWQKCLLLDPETKKILVMQRSDYKKDGWKRDVIGGTVEFGEELSEAIKREAEEETWIVLDVVRPLDIHSRMIGEERFFVFNLRVCEAWHYINDSVVLSDEHTAWQRVDRTTFDQLELKDTVAHVKPIIKKFITA